jgi:hypothetical protein
MSDVGGEVDPDDGRSEWNQWIAEMQDCLNFQPLIDFLERLKEPVACNKLPQPPAVEGECLIHITIDWQSASREGW